MCQHNLPCSIVYAHCLLPGRAFASLYVLLFLEKEAEIGGRDLSKSTYLKNSFSRDFFFAILGRDPRAFQIGKISAENPFTGNLL